MACIHKEMLIDAPADGHDMEYVLQRARGFQPDLIVVDTSTPSIANDVGMAAQASLGRAMIWTPTPTIWRRWWKNSI